MTPEEKFESFYSEVIEVKLKGFADLRASTSNQTEILLRILYVCVIVISPLLFFLFGKGWLILKFLVIIVPTAILFISGNSLRLQDKYSSRFKKEIIGSIVHFHNPGLKYDPDDGIMLPAVEISKIFGDSLKDFSSCNLVKGKIGNTWVSLSNVELVHDTWGMNPIFKGDFLIAEFSKKFAGEYYVISTNQEAKRTIGANKILQQTNRIRPSLIRVDSPEFEQEFTVFGSDTAEALYILTPSLMQRMLDFKKKIQADVHFSFNRSKMFAAIQSTGKPVTPSLKEDVDKRALIAWNKNLEFALDLVNDLNLNTRIWSKA
jgi:hypothetical protein